MADIEKKNIDIGALWWSEGVKKEYRDSLRGKEFGKTEIEADRKKAEELLRQIQIEPGTEAKKDVIKKNYSTLPPEIKTAINQLNRPQAQKGIEQSYANIDSTIKDSKKEKGIAGILGKIMNRINP